MAVSYSGKGDSFVALKPSPWSETRVMNNGFFFTLDLTPDGKRIVAFTSNAEDEKQMLPTHLTFLLNFFDHLQRRN